MTGWIPVVKFTWVYFPDWSIECRPQVKQKQKLNVIVTSILFFVVCAGLQSY